MKLTAKDEGTIFTLSWAQSHNLSVPQSAYPEFLRKNFGPAGAKIIESEYSLSKFKAYGELAAFAAISEVINDSTYKCPAYLGAMQTAAKNIPSWTFEFTHKPACPWTKDLSAIPQEYFSYVGATHTAEIPYVFGNMQHYNFKNKTCTVPASDHRLSKQMMSLWTAMAENANPSTNAIHWPRFNGTTKSYSSSGLIFGNSTTSGEIDFSSCALWAKIRAMQSTGNSTATAVSPSGSGKGHGGATTSASSIPTNGANALPSTGGVLLFGALLMSLGIAV